MSKSLSGQVDPNKQCTGSNDSKQWMLELMMSQTDENIVVVNADLTISFFNDEFAVNFKKLLGRNVQAGDSILDYTFPDRRKRLKSVYQQVFKGETVNSEIVISTLEGGQLIYESRYKPVTNDRGEVIQAFVSSRDISESVLAENELNQSNERYNILSKATSDVIWDWDMKSDTVTWSASIQKMFGYRMRNVKGDGDWRNNRIHPEDFPHIQDQFRKMLNGKKVNWQEEYRFRCADGTYKHVYDRGFIMYDGEKRAVRVIGAMQDITSQNQKAEEREQLLRELTSHNNDLKQFSYITSHNLRAPLSNIVGLLHLINDIQIEDDQLKELLGGLQVSASQLQETIDDLGQIISIKNSPTLYREKIGLEEITQNIMGQTKNFIDHKKVNIEVDFSEAPAVYFNKSYLESILLNLTTNAIKYQSPHRPLNIRIQSKRRSKHIVLVYEDNGIGIDVRRYKDRLFGLYQRFHLEKDGKGVGLFLIKSQMEAMEGTISVQSKVDSGTRFTLTFKDFKNDR